jgi:hypothetical protein
LLLQFGDDLKIFLPHGSIYGAQVMDSQRANSPSSTVPLMATEIFAPKPLALHPSILVVSGVSVPCYITRCSVKTEHPSKGPIFGIARGWILYRDQLNTFEVLPLSIEGCFGFRTRWNEPKYDQPISTPKPLENWSAAQAAFRGWAQRAFEQHWRNFTPSPWPRRRRRFLERLS